MMFSAVSSHKMTTRSVLFAIAATVVIASLAVPTAWAQSSQSRSIDEVMAAFIFQFTRYVEWPDEAFEEDGSPLIICVIGNDNLRSNLEGLVSGKNFDGRPFEIRALDEGTEVHDCHMVFIADGVEPELSDEQSKTLTISDSKSFTRNGGVIRLFQSSNKVRIEINIDAAERSEFKISSKLLALAEIVRDEG